MSPRPPPFDFRSIDLGGDSPEPPTPKNLQVVKKSCNVVIALLSFIAFLSWLSDCAAGESKVIKCTGERQIITAFLSAVSWAISTVMIIVWNVAPNTARNWCCETAVLVFGLLVTAVVLGPESKSAAQMGLGTGALCALLLAISSWKERERQDPFPDAPVKSTKFTFAGNTL